MEIFAFSEGEENQSADGKRLQSLSMVICVVSNLLRNSINFSFLKFKRVFFSSSQQKKIAKHISVLATIEKYLQHTWSMCFLETCGFFHADINSLPNCNVEMFFSVGALYNNVQCWRNVRDHKYVYFVNVFIFSVDSWKENSHMWGRVRTLQCKRRRYERS